MSRKAQMLNRARVKAKLARFPKAMKDAVAPQLRTEVDNLVAAQKRATPDNPATPGNALRDSTVAYRNPDRALSYRIIVGAKDKSGTYIAPKVEHGHRSANGKHTPARPWFFPTYRAHRKGIRRRLAAAARKVLKQLYPR